MKNIPRIFIDEKLEVGKQIGLHQEQLHYLTKVMRTDECLVFNNGVEFAAQIHGSILIVGQKTEHSDPSGSVVLAFAPIKKTDDLINMATQMGVAKFQPVITERTVAHHINWDRMRKIAIEAAEQSGRNSIPIIEAPIKFGEFLQGIGQNAEGRSLIFADERMVNCKENPSSLIPRPSSILVGPEGGFSDSEFSVLDSAGAVGISLGKTILRAEVAAVAAIARITE